MSSVNGWGKKLTVAGGIVAVGAAAYLSYKFLTAPSTSSKPKSEMTKEEKKARKAAKAAKKAAAAAAGGDAAAPVAGGDVDKQSLCDIFDRLISEAQRTIIDLGQIEQQISQSNPQITQQQMQQVLVQQYVHRIKQIQMKVCEEFHTTEEAVDAACTTFAADPDFAPKFASLTKFNQTVTRGISMGPPNPADLAKVPDSLTVQKVIDIFTEMMENMSVAMEATCALVKEMEPRPAALDQVITELYIQKVEVIKSQLLATHGYEENILDIAVLKYQVGCRCGALASANHIHTCFVFCYHTLTPSLFFSFLSSPFLSGGPDAVGYADAAAGVAQDARGEGARVARLRLAPSLTSISYFLFRCVTCRVAACVHLVFCQV
jgi:hypothetical protein